MQKDVHSVEDVLADEGFWAWYFREPSRPAEEWERWMQQHPESSEWVQQAIRIMDDRPTESRPDKSTIENALQVHKSRRSAASVPTYRIRRYWAAAAACIILITTLGWLFWPKNGTKTPPFQVWSTDYGQKTRLVLSEGTIIQLNANSQLKGPANWEKGKDRELWLEGEAFFEVKKLAQQERFLVHTSEGTIEVTGTAFNVKARNRETSVLLTEGTVLFHSEHGKVLSMQPGDKAMANNGGVRKIETNTDEMLAWKSGLLEFNAANFESFADEIRQYYGKKVQVEGSVPAGFNLTGILSNKSLDELLEAFQLATGWECRVAGELVIIVVH